MGRVGQGKLEVWKRKGRKEDWQERGKAGKEGGGLEGKRKVWSGRGRQGREWECRKGRIREGKVNFITHLVLYETKQI